MKTFILFMGLFFLLTSAHGQSAKIKRKAIRIGDHVSDVQFNNVINFNSSTASLKNFKSKLTLVDFWAGYCGACIKKFPLLDSLKSVHQNDLNVLLVSTSSTDTRQTVDKLIRNLSGGRSFALPFILGDKKLNDIFRPSGIPYYCWLDSTFRVVALTGPEDVTAEKIAAFINGKKLELGNKQEMASYDISKPLFNSNNAGNGKELLFRSSLTKFIYGLPSKSRVEMDTNKMVIKITRLNETVINLVMFAYHFYDKPARLHFADAAAAKWNVVGQSPDWIVDNSFSYELITAPVTFPKARNYVQADLKRWFGIAARVDTLPTPCYVLVADTSRLLRYKTVYQKNDNKLNAPVQRYLHKGTLQDIATALDAKLSLAVFADKVSDIKFDILLPDDTYTLEDYRNALATYGITIINEQRPLPVLTIYSDNQN